MKKSSGRSIYLVALLLFLGGVGYLVYSGFAQNSVYFLNVGEALAAPADALQSARLFGTVSAQGIERPADGLGVRFKLQDKDDPSRSMWVNYRGAVPDTFAQGAEVIVEGGLSDAQTFSATSLMTKCPSKYQKEQRS